MSEPFMYADFLSVAEQLHLFRGGVLARERRRALGAPSRECTGILLAGLPHSRLLSAACELAETYCSAGILETSKVHEVHSSALLAPATSPESDDVAETIARTNSVITAAIGGLLLLTSPLNLLGPSGLAAIQTLVVRMDADRDRLAVAVAGHPDELARFLATNEGLRPRFATRITEPGRPAAVT